MEGLAPAKSFEDLIVWQCAHRLVLAVYGVTRAFPRQETYGLVAQLQRSVVSVPANVAEGFRRRGKADKLRFLNIAQGSLAESRYYLLLAQDLGYAKTDCIKADLEEVSRLLDSYAKAILSSVF
jgi:four helix bundle protein